MATPSSRSSSALGLAAGSLLQAEESAAVQSLRAKLQEAKKQLDDLQVSTARHAQDAEETNRRYTPICQELHKDMEHMQRLRRKQEKDEGHTQMILKRLQASRAEVRAAEEHQASLLPRMEYDTLQEELQAQVDLVTRELGENKVLKQEITTLRETKREEKLVTARRDSQASRDAFPLARAWKKEGHPTILANKSGSTVHGGGLANQGGCCKKGSAALAASVQGASALGASALAASVQGAGLSSTSSNTQEETRERATEAELNMDRDRLEAALKQSREHTRDLEQRLEKFSSRHRQLDAQNKKQRKLGANLQEKLQEELKEKAREIHVLTDMVARGEDYFGSASQLKAAINSRLISACASVSTLREVVELSPRCLGNALPPRESQLQ